MKKFLLFSLLLGGLVYLKGETLVIAAGENVRSEGLGLEEIREIYTAKRFRWGGEKIVPLNLGIDHPLRSRFEQDVLNENRDTLSRIWLQAHYQGHHPPKVVKGVQSTAEFLTKMENAIGYMDETTAERCRLKILFRTKE